MEGTLAAYDETVNLLFQFAPVVAVDTPPLRRRRSPSLPGERATGGSDRGPRCAETAGSSNQKKMPDAVAAVAQGATGARPAARHAPCGRDDARDLPRDAAPTTVGPTTGSQATSSNATRSSARVAALRSRMTAGRGSKSQRDVMSISHERATRQSR
jgi:hypothetical protein